MRGYARRAGDLERSGVMSARLAGLLCCDVFSMAFSSRLPVNLVALGVSLVAMLALARMFAVLAELLDRQHQAPQSSGEGGAR